MDSMNKDLKDLSLLNLIKVFWGQKFVIIFITSLFAILSIVISLSIPNKYTSSSILIAIESSESSSTSNLISRYGGIASLAGVQIPSSGGEDRGELALQIIKSKGFLNHLFRIDPTLVQKIFAAKKYDPKSKEIIYDDNIFDSTRGAWVRKVKGGKAKRPSYVEVFKEYSEIMNISKDKRTGFITLNITHISPEFSRYLSQLIINEANNIVRERDLENANKALEYLNKELESTQQSSIKDSMNEIIKSQLEKKMLAFVRNDYLLETIDQPFLPEKKSSPGRSLIVIFSTTLGFFISLLSSIFLHYRRTLKSSLT